MSTRHITLDLITTNIQDDILTISPQVKSSHIEKEITKEGNTEKTNLVKFIFFVTILCNFNFDFFSTFVFSRFRERRQLCFLAALQFFCWWSSSRKVFPLFFQVNKYFWTEIRLKNKNNPNLVWSNQFLKLQPTQRWRKQKTTNSAQNRTKSCPTPGGKLTSRHRTLVTVTVA